ncbi:DUF6705 family protein [Chryseobacterium taihuense]|uniref:DUF6705 domain-containing protein n=1 Tax=Chryseobacterium taihuense TaxID=1141221 RepID=A0ABY0QZD4_9FLAO|nr:DUF6705 family protein [Chryseobacterium taihuense]SDM15556.1 hypothetical protein SAMN05216273_1152 [Chryseobacterium taihuense]
MKNILIIFVLSFIGCKAQQQIVPLEKSGIPVANTYYKDLDNEFAPYIGTWKGTFENKTFIITFTKFKGYNSLYEFYDDRLAGKYTMLDSNGNVLYSTYNLANEDAKVSSLGFVENTNHTKLRFQFSDLCIDGEIHISFNNIQKTQIYWKYFTYQEFVTDDSGCAPYNEMPRGEFVLTKQ